VEESQLESITFLGINITNLSVAELNEAILKSVKANNLRQLILNVNIHAMNIAYENSWFGNLLNSAFINFCDGDGVRLGAKLLGKNIKEKITYNRWIWEFARFCEIHDLSFYMIGSKQKTIDEAVKVLKKRYPKLDVKGWRNGFFIDDFDTKSCLDEINKKKPNIILLGMGMPFQEKWFMENMHSIHFNIGLTGGAVFEYISGNVTMTPKILYNLKLEWLFRFIMEPKRLFRRYFIGNPLFLWRIIKSIFY
jgi:N-acetylglucosaminyldiphosphoundecaprenol N-acetyl-beta-D-mannosaminyltransferase